MADNNNTVALLFVGVLALVLGKAIVNSPTPTPSNPQRPRPPTDQGPMVPPGGFQPGGPGSPLIPEPMVPMPTHEMPDGEIMPGAYHSDEPVGYDDPFTSSTWSTTDPAGSGGSPGSKVVVLEYDDPWVIKKPRGDTVHAYSDAPVNNLVGGGDPGDPGAPGGDPEGPIGGDPGEGGLLGGGGIVQA